MGWWSRLRTWGARQVIQEIEAERAKGAPVPAGYFQSGGMGVINWDRGVEHDHDYTEFAKTYGDSHPCIFACVDLRASSLSSLPLRIWQRTGDEPREVTRGPAVDLLHGVNPQSTWRDLIYSTSVDYDLNGNAYWHTRSDSSGRFPAVELWRLPADQVYIKPGGSWVESFIVGRGLKAKVFPADEVVHFRFPHPFNDLYGLSRLLSAALTADSDKRARESDLDSLKNGLVYDALMPIGGAARDEEVAALQERINKKFAGKHGIVPVTEGTTLLERQTARRDMEFAVMREMNREDICQVFRIPPPMVQVLTRATYANIEECNRIFWGSTMADHAAAIQGHITEFLLPRFGNDLYAELDFSDIEALQEDTLAERTQMWAETQGGAWMINEFRQKWEPKSPTVTWGNEGYMPMSQMPVSMIAEAQAASKEPLPPETPPAKVLTEGSTSRAVSAQTDACGESRDSLKQEPGISGDTEPHPFPRTGVKGDRLWKAFDRRARPLELRMQRSVETLIAAQMRGVQARLQQHPPPAGKALGQKDAAGDWFDYLIWDEAAEVVKWQAALTPLQTEALRTGALATIADIGSDIRFDLTDPGVRTHLAERKQIIKTIVGNREAELRASLTQGYEGGENLRDLMKRVDQYGINGGYRAERIARTEVIGGMNAGALEGMTQAGIEWKQWVTTRDMRTRDAHALLDGKTLKVGENFHSAAGGSGPAPGQMGRAADDVNCRCALAAVEGPAG